MNRWNLLHTLANFSAFFIALSLLNKMPNPIVTDTLFKESSYSPATFGFFSLLIICVATISTLLLKEKKNNFVFFFALYPIWSFGAIMPLFASTALYGAWASWWIFLLATIAQIVLTLILKDAEY